MFYQNHPSNSSNILVDPSRAPGHASSTPLPTPLHPQDKADDLALGMKSTALRFGDATPQWLAGFSAAMMASLAMAGAVAGQSWPYYLGLGAVGLHVGNQVGSVKRSGDETVPGGVGGRMCDVRWMWLRVRALIVCISDVHISIQLHCAVCFDVRLRAKPC